MGNVALAGLEARYAPDPVAIPLPVLLRQGGDDRLAIDPATGLNGYGCAPSPRSGVIAFSSSTASSISPRAFRRARFAYSGLVRDLAHQTLAQALELRFEAVRRTLRSQLGIEHDVVFSSSGTDSQLHAHCFTRMLLDGPLTTIVLAADQTGSGTAFTSRGCHFSSITAHGREVIKGAAIGGGEAASIAVALVDETGAARPSLAIDSAVIDAVAREVAAGRKVLLQAMDSSKLGWRAPSDACLDAIRECWPDEVQVVVDACQWRVSHERIRHHLGRGAMVLVTGSKFFMGPCFSGAALIPSALSRRLAHSTAMPANLADYLSRSDVPASWSLRDRLPAPTSPGPWLRWEAALEEIAAYHALPADFAPALFARLGRALTDIMASSQSLHSIEDGGCPREETPTIFAFTVSGRDGAVPHDDMVRLYRALNTDISRMLPASASDGARRLAARLCHIGQPVRLGNRSVLRIAFGARTASETWAPDAALIEHNIERTIGDCATVAAKIDLLVRSGLSR